jgi:hypothetical protein
VQLKLLSDLVKIGFSGIGALVVGNMLLTILHLTGHLP